MAKKKYDEWNKNIYGEPLSRVKIKKNKKWDKQLNIYSPENPYKKGVDFIQEDKFGGTKSERLEYLKRTSSEFYTPRVLERLKLKNGKK